MIRSQSSSKAPEPPKQTPSKEPFAWPCDRERITLAYGAYWKNVYTPANPHMGLDTAPYPGSQGEPAYSPITGVVSRVVYSSTGLGNHVKVTGVCNSYVSARNINGDWIELNRGEPYTMILAHLDSISVKQGQKIAAGQTVGAIGSTGFSFAPHIHWELHLKGQRCNALDFAIQQKPEIEDKVIYSG